MKRLLIALLFICPSAFAAYSEIVLEGVKQSNGVWSTAGVMDSMGFVRTTGTVAVAGATSSTAVALAADGAATALTLRSAARSLGPYAVMAVGAYDFYEWMTSDDGEPCPQDQNQLCHSVDPALVDNSYTYGSFWDAYNGSRHGYGSTQIDACKALAYSYVPPSGVTVTVSASTCYFSGQLSGTSPLTLKACTCSGGVCTGISNQNSCKLPTNPNDPLHAPYTEEDYRRLEDPTWMQTADAYNKVPMLRDQGVPIKSTSFTPYSTWMGDPYFKDGTWWRDRADISPCPTSSNPFRICVDYGPQKFEGATDPQTPPAEATGPATGTTPKEQPSFCKENPQSIACQEMGKPDEAEPIEPDEKQFQLDTSQSWGAANGACPASPSVTLFTGKVITFDYRPTCDFLALLRPIIIAFALMTALFIALGRTD